MTHDEIIKALFDETMIGNAPAVLELTNKALAEGMGPDTILFEALIPSLEEVGARFERGTHPGHPRIRKRRLNAIRR